MGRTQKARPDSLRIKAAGVLWLRRFCATVALITASKGTVKSYVQNSLQAAEKALLYGFVADADGEFRVMTLADVSHTMPLASLGCMAVNISMCVRRIRERFFVSTASIVSIFPRGKTGELCVGITPSGHFARLYQFLVREPPSLPVFDTKLVGSFLPHRGGKRLWQGFSRGISRDRMIRKMLPYIENPAQTAKVAVCAGPFYPARALRQIVLNDLA